MSNHHYLQLLPHAFNELVIKLVLPLITADDMFRHIHMACLAYKLANDLKAKHRREERNTREVQ